MKGKIIVIEGTDCSGKETQTSLLVQRLRREGRYIERFSFPNYESPTGRIIGGSFLGKEYIGHCVFPEGPAEVDPKVAVLYYAADRKYNIGKIKEYLDNGVDVILDRYVESNMACQGGKILDKDERFKLYEELENLEYGFLELPRPDLTILLYMPYEKSKELRRGRAEAADLVESSPIYLKNAERAYLELAELHNYKKIDCVDKKKQLRDIEDIQEEVYKYVTAELNK